MELKLWDVKFGVCKLKMCIKVKSNIFKFSMASLLIFPINSNATIPEKYVEKYIHVDRAKSNAGFVWTKEPTVIVDNLSGYQQDLSASLSEYGGFLNTKYEATGYFRVEEINGRWWMIDPEGHLTFMSSVVALRPGLFDEFSPFRDFDHWAETQFPYLKSIGIYTGGGPVTPEQMVKTEHKMNYTPVRNALTEFTNYLGLPRPKDLQILPVFHEEHADFIDNDLREYLAKYNGDPRFLGLYVDIEMPFDVEVLKLCLEESQTHFNYLYAVNWVQEFRGNSEPVTIENITELEKEEFFRHYVDSYYAPVSAAMKKYAPNHLYLGSRVFQTDLLTNKIFVETYAQHADVLSVNRFGYWSEPTEIMDNMIKWGGKPWLVSAFYAKGSSFEYHDNIEGAGLVTKTQKDRGHYYQNATLTWMQSKGNVGWTWFEYQDNNHINNPKNESVSNKGMFDMWHRPYEELTSSIKQVNRQYLNLVEFFDDTKYANTTKDTVFASFKADKTNIEPSNSITFSDSSQGANLDYEWSFPGGSPSTSTDKSPSVTYASEGVYDVTLKVSNEVESDQETWQGKIIVESADKPPTIKIYEPTDNIQFYQGHIFTVKSETNDNGGKIDFVEFYINGDFVNKRRNPPYNLNNWEVSATGEHTIVAKAVDVNGDVIPSEPVRYIGISSELEADFSAIRQDIRLGESVNFANESSHNANRWEWVFEGGTPTTSTSKSPTVTYSTPGDHSVKLTAFSDDGSEMVVKNNFIRVSNSENELPIVNIISPTNGASYPIGSKVTIEVDATDTDGEIESVTFFVSNNSIKILNQAPYRLTDFVVEEGLNKIDVVAIDNDNDKTISSITVMGVEMDNLPPTVSIVEPTNNTEFEEGHVIERILAIAADEDGEIAQVEFFANGQHLTTVTQPPYQHNNYTVGVGNVTLSAVATDDKGATATSEVSITGKPVEANKPPTVWFHRPANGEKFEAGEVIIIRAYAEDQDGEIDSLEIFINGESVKQTSHGSNRIPEWEVTEGVHTLTAVAIDNQGAKSTEIITIYGVDSEAPLVPTVEIVVPYDGKEYNLGDIIPKVEATAQSTQEGVTIANVEFFVNGEGVRIENHSPYRYWNHVLDKVGVQEIKAVATDSNGAKSESTIHVVVKDPEAALPPSVEIVVPYDGKEYNLGDTIKKVEATAQSNQEGVTIVNVEFFVNGESVKVSNLSPYRHWNQVLDKIGEQEIKAVATDSNGAKTETTINVIVK
ncbi:TPA: Ig-like domain-containing protein [Vibrio vulnificus]